MALYSLATLAPEYRRLWSQMRVIKVDAANGQARRVIANKAIYKRIEKRTGVPWFVVGCMHMRESNGDFRTYLGNGQPLSRRTTIVPKGRGPWTGPNAFEDGAYDALVTVEHLDQIRQWGPEHVAYGMEKFNGFGYRNPRINIPSPYLWGGTNVQKRGKYVRDGVYDASVMDPQLGGMAVLKQIMALDPEASFRVGPAVVAARVAEVEPEEDEEDAAPDLADRASPAAVDTVTGTHKPPAKSKTVWGAVISFLSGTGATILSLLSSIPPWVGVVLLIALAVGAYMVIRGRIDVEKVVKHLSQDDDEVDGGGDVG